MKIIFQAFMFAFIAASSFASQQDETSAQQLRRKLKVSAEASPVGASTSTEATRAVPARLVSDSTSPLGLCTGDCDKDSDCQSGLVCFQRNAGDNVPGCSLTSSQRSSSADFCVAKSTDTVPSPPTMAPSMSPSPTENLNASDAPTVNDAVANSFLPGSTFALKLYWEQGYNWQDEPFERKWCMKMKCSRFCLTGGEVVIENCDSRPTRWEFVSHGPNEVQIKVANRNLCLREHVDNDLELARCDGNNPKQRFVANGGSFDGRRFEVSPKDRLDWCMTQRHHPKSGEYVNLEPCVSVRRKDSRTSYWNKY